MADEFADIEDEQGNVIGTLNVTTMRAVAPHYKLDEVIAAGGDYYYRKNGMRVHLRPDLPKPKRRRR